MYFYCTIKWPGRGKRGLWKGMRAKICFFLFQFLGFSLDDKAVLNMKQSVPGEVALYHFRVVSDPVSCSVVIRGSFIFFFIL